MSDFGNYINPVAVKQHRCEWCNGPIPKGEKHTQFKGIFEGEWQNWRMHDECYADASKDDWLTDGFMPGDGEMPQRVKELIGEAGRGNG